MLRDVFRVLGFRQNSWRWLRSFLRAEIGQVLFPFSSRCLGSKPFLFSCAPLPRPVIWWRRPSSPHLKHQPSPAWERCAKKFRGRWRWPAGVIHRSRLAKCQAAERLLCSVNQRSRFRSDHGVVTYSSSLQISMKEKRGSREQLPRQPKLSLSSSVSYTEAARPLNAAWAADLGFFLFDLRSVTGDHSGTRLPQCQTGFMPADTGPEVTDPGFPTGL